MIGYTLKHVLDLVPEALDFVKSASVEQDYPLDSKDSCLASALAIEYKNSISGQPVDYDVMDKVASAVEAYNLSEKVHELSVTMVTRSRNSLIKAASAASPDTYLTKQAYWEGELTGFTDIESLVKEAKELAQEAQSLGVTPCEKVDLYGGKYFLSKQAALDALGARFYATKNDTFVKLAAALSNEKDILPPGNLTDSLCSTVTKLDKKAGLSAKGFNFYKETLISKEAAMNYSVKVAGTDYPLQRVMSIPSEYADQYLGKGFMQEVNSDPGSAKHMVESLPMDSQNVLATLLKNAR